MQGFWLHTALGATALTLATAAIAAPTAPAYVAQAGASDLYEVQSSQLVLASTRNEKLRGFAQRMVTDHEKSTALVKAAAGQSGLVAKPPVLSALQKKNLADLKAASGPARDALYLKQQHVAHQQALALHQDYAGSGDKPALKGAAAKIVPVVQQHIAAMPH